MDQSTIRKIKKLYKIGMRVTEIAKAFGITESTVMRVVKKGY